MAAARPLFDALLRHQVYVQRLASGEVDKVLAFLKELDQAIRDELSSADEITDFARSRLEQLLNAVDRLMQAIFDRFAKVLTGNLLSYADAETEFSTEALDRAATDFEAVVPATTQVRAVVVATPLAVTGPSRGKLLAELIDHWTQSERRAVLGLIRRGAFEGLTNGQIVRQIRGTAAMRYQDGMLDLTRRHADAVVRTAVQHVSTVAREETLKRNADIIKAFEWVATLDKRTCPSCRALDGREFPIDYKKAPKPPLHIKCRCTLVPVLKDEFAKLMAGATRASKGDEGGKQVPSTLSYYEWLKGQSAGFQDEVLGPTRGKLFRDGGLSATRFAELQVDKYFQPITLDEMRARNPIVFADAGL